MMHNYFYLDANNYVIGYDNLDEIKHLIKIGIIHEHTKIYNRYGKEVSREQILTETKLQTKQNPNNEINIEAVYKPTKIPIISYKNTSYRRIVTVKIICEILSTVSLFLGYIVSFIVFIIFLHYNKVAFAFLILIGGFAISTYLWLLLGFCADLLKWMLNISTDLHEIKSRSIHNE
jgi:hypothetical protein